MCILFSLLILMAEYGFCFKDIKYTLDISGIKILFVCLKKVRSRYCSLIFVFELANIGYINFLCLFYFISPEINKIE